MAETTESAAKPQEPKPEPGAQRERGPAHPNPSMADAELLTLKGKKIKVTDEEFAIMLEKAGGFKSRVAKQLGISVSAVCHRIQRSEYLRDACRTVEETVLDLAEASLVRAAQNGEAWAVTFILKCKGRKRGWIERNDVVFGSEMDAPPPPFVIELHDPAFVAAERKRQEEELAKTIDAIAVDVTSKAADAAPESQPVQDQQKPAAPPKKPVRAKTSGPSGPSLDVETDTYTEYRDVGAQVSAETASGAAQNAPKEAEGQRPAPTAEAPQRPQEPPRPRTPSEAAAMRREREARERAAQGQSAPQPQPARPSTPLPMAFPKR